MMNQAYGLLAQELLHLELPLQVCESESGYYIGTNCPQDGPISRESEEYYPTRDAAQAALDTGRWTQLTVDMVLAH
jgi:hypothetical protein